MAARTVHQADAVLSAAPPAQPSAELKVPLLHSRVSEWGTPLTEADYDSFEKSWISREIADSAGLRRVNSTEGRDLIGHKGKKDYSGIVIPYYLPWESRPHSHRIRRDNPDLEANKDGVPRLKGKYLGAPGAGNRLYFPPGITREQLSDTSIPLIVVEGEKKALALSRLALHEAAEPRFIAVAIPGVWNWRGIVGKTGGPAGERLDVHGPVNDLALISWNGRKSSIVFDANLHTSKQVQVARRSLSLELSKRDAEVGLIDLPPDCGVNGVDDLLFAWGPERVLELLQKPIPATRLHVASPTQFEATPQGLFRYTTKGEQVSRVQLTSYRAAIAANICIDDGVEQQREFELECEVEGRTFTFNIPARDLAPMDWPITKMGSRAVTFPNQKDWARTAIQSLSFASEDRSIYSHSGWRKIAGNWMFLHAGGAVDGSGVVGNIDVRLPGALSRYHLPVPPSGEVLVVAVKASLRLARLGPVSICFPLLAATIRAVFGDSDFSLHLAGPTGAFKSELAALFQQFFGLAMVRKNLPGSWSSTGNALEALAFHAKDVLFTIDDFAPQGGLTDIARYHSNADKVFRAAGNHSGRGRMDATARLRDIKPPRGLILSTGEEIPKGQSVRARLLILELSKGEIRSDRLSECQRQASEGRYAEAMAGFLQWLAGRYDAQHAVFNQRFAELRERAVGNAAHARTPDIVAGLAAAFEVYLDFARQCGAVDDDLHRALSEDCWNALMEASASQGKHQLASEPAARYISLLVACLASGQAHLAARDGTTPDVPAACGWRYTGSHWEPQGRCIGWLDEDNIYLEPTAAFEIVQTVARNSGDTFSIGETTLRKRLHEKNLLASVDEVRDTLAVRRRLGGSNKTVLHLHRVTLLPGGAVDSAGDAND